MRISNATDGLSEGSFVRQGDVIAYVGDTGNAGVGNYHLHFSISALSDPKRYWEGTAINPYPLLRSMSANSAEPRSKTLIFSIR